MSLLIDNLNSARKSGVPLIAIVTQDQPAMVGAIEKGLPQQGPWVRWDCINGLGPLNEEAKKILQGMGDALRDSHRPTMALRLLLTLPPKSLVFFFNSHPLVCGDRADPTVAQAIQNLREPFKEDKRSLILLGPSFFDLREELRADVVTLDEPLPTDEQLGTLITELHESASKTLDKKKLPLMVDAVRGLPAMFTVEQVTAMSFRAKGLDMDALWERKQNAINATQGLTITKSKLQYADLAGMDVVMDYLNRLQAGPNPFRLVLFWDEIEKMMGGAGGDQTDSSGVSSDQLAVCLKVMERLRWAGIILLGVPGSGKTALAEATSGEFDVPKIEQDFGAMKGRYVGDSEGAIRQAFRVIEGIGGSDVLVIATCNKLKSLPAEFRRRFWLGLWYFDVPSLTEQEPIKRIYEKKYALDTKGKHGEWPDTLNWTGAEIRNCADLAVRLGCDLKYASRFVVPVAKADPESIDALRDVADGKFLSVNSSGRTSNDDGTWTREKAQVVIRKSTGRRAIES